LQNDNLLTFYGCNAKNYSKPQSFYGYNPKNFSSELKASCPNMILWPALRPDVLCVSAALCEEGLRFICDILLAA
jgi:hypothetical protein